MDITDEMLRAAVRKAVEAGLLPRNACRDEANESKEIMRLIVQAALSVGPQDVFTTAGFLVSSSHQERSFPMHRM